MTKIKNIFSALVIGLFFTLVGISLFALSITVIGIVLKGIEYLVALYFPENAPLITMLIYFGLIIWGMLAGVIYRNTGGDRGN